MFTMLLQDFKTYRLMLIQDQETQVLGVRIHYLERSGDSQLLPVILLHGFATGCFVWKDLIRCRQIPHRILAPDLPGNGTSDQPAEIPSLSYYVRFVEAFRQQMRVERFNAIGHSMGSTVLAAYSTQYTRVQTLVLESPPDDQASTPLSWKLLSVRFLGDALLQFYPANRHALRQRLQRSVHHPESITEEYLEDSWKAFREGSLRKWIPLGLRMKRSSIAWHELPPCRVKDFARREKISFSLRSLRPLRLVLIFFHVQNPLHRTG